MRLRWIRMRGLPPTFISPSPSPPPPLLPPIATHLARARFASPMSLLDLISGGTSKRDRYTPITADPEQHNGLVSVIERRLGHFVPSQVESIIKSDSMTFRPFPDVSGVYREVIAS